MRAMGLLLSFWWMGFPIRRGFLLWACVALLTCADVLPAAEQSGLSTTGVIPPAKLIGIDKDGGLTLQSQDKKSSVAAQDLVVWGKFAESDRGPLVLLSDGSWLMANLVGLSADEYRFDSRLLGEITLARGSVRGILFRLPADKLLRDRVLDRLQSRADTHELLLLANGDELVGQTAQYKFDADSGRESLLFTVTGAPEASELLLSKVAALALDPVLIEEATPRGAHGLLGLRDGSRLVVTSITPQAKRTEFALASGLKLKFDQDSLENDVVAWQPLGRDVLFLSDLRTTGYKHIPFLTLARPYENDRTDLGSRLRQGGAVFSKGLGMTSTSRLAYDVPAGYRQFQAEVALDDIADDRGSVIFRVFTNSGEMSWKTAYESPVVRGGEAPRSIQIDLAGVQRLALIVDFAERGDEQDHPVWLNARLVK